MKSDAEKTVAGGEQITIAAFFKKSDRDGDGKLSRQEFRRKAIFNNVDGDGFASKKEVRAYFARRRGSEEIDNKSESTR